MLFEVGIGTCLGLDFGEVFSANGAVEAGRLGRILRVVCWCEWKCFLDGDE